MPNYIYIGHAIDVTSMNETTKKYKLVRKHVPPNCNYINASESSECTFISITALLIKMAQNHKISKYLNNPKRYELKISLHILGFLNGEFTKEYAKTNTENGIRIHEAGNLYVASRPQFWFELSNNRYYKVGLYDSTYDFLKYSNKKIYPHVTYDDKDKDNTTIPIFINTEKHFSVQFIQDIFEGSLYPTFEDIIQRVHKHYKLPFTRIELVDPKLLITEKLIKHILIYELFNETTVHDLMIRFPGNHYNCLCRSYHGNHTVNNLESEKEASANRVAHINNNTFENDSYNIEAQLNRGSHTNTHKVYIDFKINMFKSFCRSAIMSKHLGDKCKSPNVLISHIIKLYKKLSDRYSDLMKDDPHKGKGLHTRRITTFNSNAKGLELSQLHTPLKKSSKSYKLSFKLLYLKDIEEDMCIGFIIHLHNKRIKRIPSKLIKVQIEFMKAFIQCYLSGIIKKYNLKIFLDFDFNSHLADASYDDYYELLIRTILRQTQGLGIDDDKMYIYLIYKIKPLLKCLKHNLQLKLDLE
jgi:hypothetical protein